jgi:membrane protein implicated in regulation of membrane protease activity
MIGGERWRAVWNGVLKDGQQVRIHGREGLTLHTEPVEEGA